MFYFFQLLKLSHQLSKQYCLLHLHEILSILITLNKRKMKKLIAFIHMLCIFIVVSKAQSVAINSDASLPNASAILDVSSIDKGLLIPRMTTGQRDAILSPATGLLIFQTDVTAGYYYFNGTGWTQLASGGASNYWSLSASNIYSNISGNVGIGTPSPLAKLSVQTGTSNYGIIHTDGNITVGSYIGNGKGWLGTKSNHPLSFFTNNSNEQMTLLPNGNFGIGTINPLSKLNIQTPNNSDGFIHSSDGGIILKDVVGGISAAFGTYSNHTFRLVANSIAAVNIDPTGKVGIGVSFPASKLSILSNTINSANNTDVLQVAGINPLQAFSNEAGVNVAYLKGVTNLAATPQYPNQGLEIGAAPNNSIFLSANYGPVLTIASNNNVGIGTTNPTYKLSVNGNIRSKEVVVETGWADYVFDKKYKLLPLGEVEKFIEQNNHLPNIPSAKEIETNGLHLGETQKLMMEKIEELTLYIIQQQKEIDKLKIEFSQLK